MSKNIHVNGRKFEIHGRDGDPYYEDLINVGNKTNDFLFYMADKFVQAGDTVIDIGANIGITTCVLAAAAAPGRVLSFEPGPDTFERLQQTVAANKLDNVTTYQLALGSTSGTVAFLDNQDSGSASHLAPAGTALGGSNFEVTVQEFDRFSESAELTRIDFMKLDVEGFELDVLKGGAATIARLKPKVFLEFNTFTLIAYGNRNPRTVLEYLIDTFPFVYRFEGGQPIIIKSEAEQLGFIHDNLLRRGCVDDLVCCYKPLS